jgi:hypothetical protein
LCGLLLRFRWEGSRGTSLDNERGFYRRGRRGKRTSGVGESLGYFVKAKDFDVIANANCWTRAIKPIGNISVPACL